MFEASCGEVVGGCGATCVTHHAISIDVREFGELRDAPEVLAEEERIVADRPLLPPLTVPVTP